MRSWKITKADSPTTKTCEGCDLGRKIIYASRCGSEEYVGYRDGWELRAAGSGRVVGKPSEFEFIRYVDPPTKAVPEQLPHGYVKDGVVFTRSTPGMLYWKHNGAVWVCDCETGKRAPVNALFDRGERVTLTKHVAVLVECE